MAIRKIVTEEDAVLRKKCRPVTDFNKRLFTLLDDMKDTLESVDGAGLAAPQVGVLRRVFITRIDGEVTEYINPEILGAEGIQTVPEGCLSIPGYYGTVERPQKLTVKAFDRNGNEFEKSGEDLLAKAISHENDHLNGVLYTDKAYEVHESGSEEKEE
ncbi:MAG: peptide deformylase [Oscillospiraceae bacterium]|jgi:peptide deformylase|nr:peptide deformylase [Oscillospiraceae bacterium]